jgi:hypothetical protein
MAANVRANAANWAQGDLLTPTQANTIDTNAAAAIKRSSTVGGLKALPITYCGSTDSAGDKTPLYFNGAHYLKGIVGGAIGAVFSLNLLHGHTLTGVRVVLMPGGVHGAQPATLPSLSIAKISIQGTLTSLGSVTYTWVSVPVYEDVGGVYLDVLGLNEVVNNAAYHYVAQIMPEGGANALDAKLCSIQAQMTVDTAEGGADFSLWR